MPHSFAQLFPSRNKSQFRKKSALIDEAKPMSSYTAVTFRSFSSWYRTVFPKAFSELPKRLLAIFLEIAMLTGLLRAVSGCPLSNGKENMLKKSFPTAIPSCFTILSPAANAALSDHAIFAPYFTSGNTFFISSAKIPGVP